MKCYEGKWVQRGALRPHAVFNLNGGADNQLYIPVGAEGWKDRCNAFNLSTQEFEQIPSHQEVFEVDLSRSRANWEEDENP